MNATALHRDPTSVSLAVQVMCSMSVVHVRILLTFIFHSNMAPNYRVPETRLLRGLRRYRHARHAIGRLSSQVRLIEHVCTDGLHG